MIRAGRILEVEGLGQFFDSLVDLAEQRLVAANLACPLIHLIYRPRRGTLLSESSCRSEGSLPTARDSLKGHERPPPPTHERVPDAADALPLPVPKAEEYLELVIDEGPMRRM